MANSEKREDPQLLQECYCCDQTQKSSGHESKAQYYTLKLYCLQSAD